MKMSNKDALHILGLKLDATKELIKQAYRKACAQYHPDRNPAGAEMMKLVNCAYDALENYEPVLGVEVEEEGAENYGENINAALQAIAGLGLDIELCGSWLWIGGNTYPHREALKNAGFKFAPKKKQWYFRPADYKSFNRKTWDMDKIREAHGSKKIIVRENSKLAAA